MKNTRLCIQFVSVAIFSLQLMFPVVALEKPDLMLAKVFHPSVDITKYWISEKLDGVRARWDGRQLVSRGGTIFKTPKWFVQGFPDQLLDGELWIARGEYQQTVSIVRKQTPHEGWRKIKFMVFDLPAHSGEFSSRVIAMRKLNNRSKSSYLDFIQQFRVSSKQMLMWHFYEVIEHGGEGLMLHHQKSIYQSGRSNDLLKFKPYDDTEAVVIGYRPGKGKFSGKMGALKVRMTNGKEFFIAVVFHIKNGKIHRQ